MEKEELFNKRKSEFIFDNNILGKAFFLTNTFFSFLWVISGFVITSNTVENEIGPIIVFVFTILTIISLIVGIALTIRYRNKYTKKVEYFNEEEKLKFIHIFRKTQIIYSNALLIGILIILGGIAIRDDFGIEIASVGVAVAGLSISTCIYYRILRRSYSTKKSNIINDIIKEKSLYYSTSIIERIIYVCFIIAILIMTFNLILNYKNKVNEIFLFITYLLFMAYNLFIEIKSIIKLKKQ